MNEENVKKRGWVKNAAIIFLAVMLVLTFFSNTIMNRSLPEVAAQYTTSGSITARIRGSGTVRANEIFDVMATQSRTINLVPVKVGDEVEIGDVLISLTGEESKDLREARNELHKLEVELEKLLVEMTRPDSNIATANRGVQEARSNLSDAQRKLSEIHYSEEALSWAQSAVTHAHAVVSQARAVVVQREATSFSTQSAVTAASREFELAVALLAMLEPPVPPEPPTPEYEAALKRRNNAEIALLHARAVYDDANIALAAAQAALEDARTTEAVSEAEFKTQQGHRTEWLTQNDEVKRLQHTLEGLVLGLTDAQGNASVDNSLEAISLSDQRRQIEDKREVIEELEKEGMSSEITTPVSGIVISIREGIKPGQQIDDLTDPLMKIEVIDRGYSISDFTITAEQASRVNIGDMAEVDRGWWSGDDEIRATLINIRNDPDDPVMKRILRFNITGDVKSGDKLNLTLAQRSENYNIIVPNSAIRSDTNGDFVLVVMSRSSPLGNRYIATRVDVTILASDDTNTAISGALTGWDFVVTTSTAPIDPGMQVRLVDNP